jgi:aminopeptidase N
VAASQQTATAQQAESRPLTWLADYRPPPYTVDDVHLAFNIEDAQTTISSTLRCRRNQEQHDGAEEAMPPIVLDGGPPSDLTLLGVTLDGTALRAGTDFKARLRTCMRTHMWSAHSLTLQVLLLLCG